MSLSLTLKNNGDVFIVGTHIPSGDRFYIKLGERRGNFSDVITDADKTVFKIDRSTIDELKIKGKFK